MSNRDWKNYSKEELKKLDDMTLSKAARDQLLTCDGKGTSSKSDILDEIITRWISASAQANFNYLNRD